MDESVEGRHSWVRRSLPALLAVAALLAIAGTWFAVKLRQTNRQRAAVEAIQRLGGHVLYDYQHNCDDSRYAPPPGPAWLRAVFGIDFVATVDDVFLGESADDDVLRNLDGHLKALPGLKWLYMERTKKVTDAGFRHLAGLSQVKHLWVSGTSITDSGLEHFHGFTNLEWLELHETGVTDFGLQHLAGLKHLVILDLSKTKITGQGLRYLTGLENLETLDLSNTDITDEGLRGFGTPGGFPALEDLDLTGTAVNGPGLRTLGRLPRLRRLSLSGTRVGDDLLEYVKDLRELRSLVVGGTHVTDDGLVKLRGEMTICGIWVRDPEGPP